ncbi:hypothetical protein G6L28_21065 [Agrobacterium larrymoorei]|uniref:hypothetical protein n=1 Tax=Agrobacterium larrymoorei TaxID=160699 RepID=UPI0015722998|nr:hypothetical protein [Agrobacterium larrymoorei]NTJ45080.1 hypothetical protein [Agrobacterium larrymoorei]
MKRYLLIALGFTTQNLDVLHLEVAKRGFSDRIRIVSRPYPKKSRIEQNTFDSSDFDFVIDAAYRSLFEDKGQTLFCNHEHKVCALQFGRTKKSCVNLDPSRCRESRPDVIILAYLANPSFRMGGRVGRFALPLKCPEDLFGKSERLAHYCISQIDYVEEKQCWIPFSEKASRRMLLLPLRNFENGERVVALNSIQSPADFIAFKDMVEDIVTKKGQKIIDKRDMEFKVDIPHRYPTNDVDKIHLLNAHYRHGFWFDCRHHYDVTEKDDAYVRKVKMVEIKTNDHDHFSGDHLNIFSNDEIQ